MWIPVSIHWPLTRFTWNHYYISTSIRRKLWRLSSLWNRRHFYNELCLITIPSNVLWITTSTLKDGEIASRELHYSQTHYLHCCFRLEWFYEWIATCVSMAVYDSLPLASLSVSIKVFGFSLDSASWRSKSTLRVSNAMYVSYRVKGDSI